MSATVALPPSSNNPNRQSTRKISASAVLKHSFGRLTNKNSANSVKNGLPVTQSVKYNAVTPMPTLPGSPSGPGSLTEGHPKGAPRLRRSLSQGSLLVRSASSRRRSKSRTRGLRRKYSSFFSRNKPKGSNKGGGGSSAEEPTAPEVSDNSYNGSVFPDPVRSASGEIPTFSQLYYSPTAEFEDSESSDFFNPSSSLLTVQPAASTPSVHLGTTLTKNNSQHSPASSTGAGPGPLMDPVGGGATLTDSENLTDHSKSSSNSTSGRKISSSSKRTGSKVSIAGSGSKLSIGSSSNHRQNNLSKENISPSSGGEGGGNGGGGSQNDSNHSRSSSPKLSGSSNSKSPVEKTPSGTQLNQNNLNGNNILQPGIDGRQSAANIGRIQSAATSIKNWIVLLYNFLVFLWEEFRNQPSLADFVKKLRTKDKFNHNHGMKHERSFNRRAIRRPQKRASLALLAPNYKSRNEEFRKLFRKLAENDKFVIDYSCAIQKEILHQGRMYLSTKFLCFYANIFMKWETNIVINFKDIASITKEKTAKVIPNALQVVTTSGEKYFFASFASRDKSYMMMFKLWQSALLDQTISPQELLVWSGYDPTELVEGEEEEFLEMEEQENMYGENSVFQKTGSDFTSGSVSMEMDPPAHSSSLNENTVPRWTVGGEDISFMAGGSISNNEGGGGAGGISPAHSNNSSKSDTNLPDKEKEKERQKVDKKRTRGKEKRGASAGGHLSVPLPISSSPAADETSESSENGGDGWCGCEEHKGEGMINEVYPLSVDQIFILLFTDSPFFKKFHEAQNSTNMVPGDWKIEKSDGRKTRTVSYTIALNHSMAPKNSGVTEKQVCEQLGKTGQIYKVTVETTNSGIPYADSFIVRAVYCLSKVSSNQCRVRCHANVEYKKNLWSIIRSFIEKNTIVGMQEHFRDLDKALRKECSRLGLPSSSTETPPPAKRGPGATAGSSKPGGVRARKYSHRVSHSKEEERRSTPGTPLPQAKNTGIGWSGMLPPEIEWMAKIILYIMVVMLLLNALLFYKLWGIESEFSASPKSHSIDYSLADLKLLLQKKDLSSEDLLRLYRSHQEQAAERWLAALQATISSLGQVEGQLKELKDRLSEAQTEFNFFAKETTRLKPAASSDIKDSSGHCTSSTKEKEQKATVDCVP